MGCGATAVPVRTLYYFIKGIRENHSLRFANYEIKVPSDKLNNFLDESSKLATVRNKKNK